MTARYILKTLTEDYGVTVTSLKTKEPYVSTMLNCNEALFLLQKDDLMMIADFREAYHHFSDKFYLQPVTSSTGYKVDMKYYIDCEKAENFVVTYFT
jgi:hypothetical protein